MAAKLKSGRIGDSESRDGKRVAGGKLRAFLLLGM